MGTAPGDYSYDAAGNMTKRQAAYGGTNDSTNVNPEWYDALNRATIWENTTANDTPYARSRYQFDSLGREVATWRDYESGLGERFDYTATNQLQKVWYNTQNAWDPNAQGWPHQEFNYTADLLNRTSVKTNHVFVPYAMANGLNQIGTVGGQTYGYDDNFNLEAMPGFSATYNAANQLTSATSNGNSVQFVYDGLGRCVKRTINNVSTIVNYDGWEPIYEWDGAGNPFAWNLYGPGADEILWRFQNGIGHLRYHTDSNGNVTSVLDWWGGLVEKYTYDAFGKPTAITDRWGTLQVDGNYRPRSGIGNRFLFQGREWIWELGIYDYRNRMYHPELGRFLQTDPIGFDAGDMNLFRYCGDDPVNRSDPTGLVDTGGTNEYSRLTSWLGGDWIKGSDGLSALDWNDRNSIRPQAGMDGGGGGSGDSNGGKSISSENEEQKRNQPGKPDYAIRSIERAYATKKGDTYYAHIFWRIQLFHKNQKPLGKGTQFREEIRWSEGVDFSAKKYIRGEQPTRDDGSVEDPWKLPFSSPNGQVKTTQTIFAGGRQAAWDATVYATGKVEAQQYVEFIEPSH